MPLPRDPMHAADVAVVQLAVLQSASARPAVMVTSPGAKLTPAIVALGVEVAARLYGIIDETTGAETT